MMKKVLIWILVLVLVAVVSVIGTIAYLTAVDEETNVMTVGDARIEIVEYERVNTDDKNTNAVVKEFRENKDQKATREIRAIPELLIMKKSKPI